MINLMLVFYTEYKALLASSGAPAHWAFCGAIVERLIIRSTGFVVEKTEPAWTACS